MDIILSNLSRLFDSANFLTNLLDIGLVTAVIYSFLLLIRGTRAVQVFRGLLLIAVIVYLIASAFPIPVPAFSWLIEKSIPAFLVAIPVVFQPELRRALEKVGHLSRYFRFLRPDQLSPMIITLKEASLRLSQRRHGALIVFEQDTGLQEYIDTGVFMNSEPSSELFLTIFNKHTELHDGAVIIRDDKIIAAACVLPLSASRLKDRQMGLRHRAALGISEVSDAVAVVISEETGQVSIAHNGRILRRQDITRLDLILQAFLQGGSQEASGS